MDSNGHETPSLRDLREKAEQALRERSGAELVLNICSSAIRSAFSLHLLLRQRNLMYADRRRLSLADNVGHAFVLLATTNELYACSREFARRVISIEPPRSSRGEQLNLVVIANSAAVTGVSLAEVKNGRTLFKKRQLSTYGRVSEAVSAATSATRLALKLRAARR
jgi:hypothetical protein